MKKALLFAILALSINAFAQNNQPMFNLQHQTLKSIDDVQGILDDKRMNKYQSSVVMTSAIKSKSHEGKDIKHQMLKPLPLIQIYDSIYQWQWDEISNGWEIKYKIINIVYDANYNQMSSISKSWNGSTWENSLQGTYTYDANNNQISLIQQNWTGSAWENTMQYTSTYDANNNWTSYLYQTWNGSAWENDWQYIFTYDINNNRTSFIRQGLNGSSFENIWKGTYTYNANNHITNSLSQYWNGSIWVNDSQDIYTLDANNYTTSILFQNWNSNDWINDSQYIYFRDANNNLTSSLYQIWNGSIWVNDSQGIYTIEGVLFQLWNGSDWVNDSQYIYTFDANNNLTSELNQNWNGTAWVNFYQDTFTYDANNFEISYSNKYWNYDGTIVEGGDSTYIYFHTVLGIEDLIMPDASIIIYPNPCSGRFTISSTRTINSIEIYNLLGELIRFNFTFNQQTLTEIDLTNEPKGIYFAKMNVGTKVYTRKIIVQ
jgi:hypothetical protein